MFTPVMFSSGKCLPIINQGEFLMNKNTRFIILLVDDEPDLLDMLSFFFIDLGYSVILANCGFEAIEILKKETIHLVISDFRMPNGNGASVLTFINTMDVKPVFFYFSSEIGFNPDEYLNQGAKGYFSKPSSIELILLEVAKESSAFFEKNK